MDKQTLSTILDRHREWLRSDGRAGERADLRGANLQGADLREADLRKAYLQGANLQGANLQGANLQDADLWEADLRRANLRDVNLRDANLLEADLREADLRDASLWDANLRDASLRDANLQGANLQGADLPGAYLPGADLGGAILPDDVPRVPGIDAEILAASGEGARLDMGVWHSSCGTAHCRAGWAVVLAGKAGRRLEEHLGVSTAAALIYAASGSHPVPDWYVDDEAALADLRARAAARKEESDG